MGTSVALVTFALLSTLVLLSITVGTLIAFDVPHDLLDVHIP